MALVEAAACGRPLIATDVPGCREVVIGDKTGLLVRLDDTASLANAIKQLADSQPLRQRYGVAARRLAVEKFSAGTVGDQIAQLYKNLVGGFPR